MAEEEKSKIGEFLKWIFGGVVALVALAWSGFVGNGASDLVRGKVVDTYTAIVYRREIAAYHEGHDALILADKERYDNQNEDAKRDYDIAVDRLTFAANGGIPRAMSVLHELYCVGRSGYVAANPAMGEKWGALAVSKGDMWGTFKC